MVSEPIVCLNDEPAEDDKIGEFEECGRMDNLSQSQACKELWSA